MLTKRNILFLRHHPSKWIVQVFCCFKNMFPIEVSCFLGKRNSLKKYQKRALRNVFLTEKSLDCTRAFKIHSRVWDISWQLKSYKMDEKWFLVYAKSSFRSWDIYIFYWLFVYVKKALDKKGKFDFKIYGVTDRTANNYNTQISRKKATRQWDLVSY